MIIKELIAKLKTLKQDKEILLSSDEELNKLFQDIEIAEMEVETRCDNPYVIWGNSGSERDF